MLLNVLAVGDVCGEGGQDILARRLRELKEGENIHFTVVNGENASVVGITPRQARGLYDAGADVITLGNHTWNRIQIADFLEKDRYILRPANYAGRVPGRGFGIYDGPRGLKIGVINLMGRLELNANLDSPFKQVNQILRREDIQQCDVVLVDFHAEGLPRRGHQREGGHGLVPGRAGGGRLGHPHPRAHGGRADSPQGDGVSLRPGHDRPPPVHSGGEAGALSEPVSGRPAQAV